MTFFNMLPFDVHISGIIPLMTSYDFIHSTEFYVIDSEISRIFAKRPSYDLL